MNPAIFLSRQLLQNHVNSSNKDDTNLAAWFIVILPIIFIVATGALICYKRRQEGKEYQLRNFEFINWTPDYYMKFKEFYNDGFNRTPLQIAIQVNNRFLVQHILNNPELQKVEVDKNLCTPLHYAARYADRNILEDIIDYTPSPLQGDHQGKTALHYAAMRAKTSETQPLKLLLQQSDYIPDQFTQDHQGHTFLHTYALEKRGRKLYGFPDDLSVQRAFVNSIRDLLDPDIYLTADHNNLKLICLVPKDDDEICIEISEESSGPWSNPSEAESTSGNKV